MKIGKPHILICGPSAAGKDTVANIILTNFNVKRARAFTTRPKRAGESDTEYHFISCEEASQIPDDIKFCQMKLNGYEYFFTETNFNQTDIAVIDPTGVMWCVEHMKTTPFLIIECVARQSVRYKRYLRRDKNTNLTEFKKREDETMREFAKLANFTKEFHINARPLKVDTSNYDPDELVPLIKKNVSDFFSAFDE